MTRKAVSREPRPNRQAVRPTFEQSASISGGQARARQPCFNNCPCNIANAANAAKFVDVITDAV
jgi:hypothetical protein